MLSNQANIISRTPEDYFINGNIDLEKYQPLWELMYY